MNFILEDGINFNDQLMEAICETDNKNTIPKCLISNKPLEEFHIKLNCNHSFNYNALFKEVLKQKKDINRLEVQKLKTHQLKCPYCRNVQDKILPYNEKCGQRVHGVNWPVRWAMHTNRCSAVLKSGKRKNQACDKACFSEYCKMHKKYVPIANASCAVILKSGKRKGNACGCRIKQNGFCGRHQPKTNLVIV